MDAETSRSDRLARNARETLALSRNCAQTSFSVLQQEFGLEGDAVLKALTPLPGVALRGETCGGITGCLMAIGLVYGRDDLADSKGFAAALGRSRKFCRQFEELQGSTACAKLLEARLGRAFNLADRGEALEYVAAGGPRACGEIIASAVQLAAGILAAEDQPG